MTKFKPDQHFRCWYLNSQDCLRNWSFCEHRISAYTYKKYDCKDYLAHKTLWSSVIAYL